MVQIGVVKEGAAGEARVALVPAHVAALVKLGCAVTVERDAGFAAGFTDGEYEEKGATIADRTAILGGADILLGVRAAAANGETGAADVAALREGAVVIAQCAPYEPDDAFAAMAQRGISALSLELIPRITRAQSMDVLSSQANLAGYRAVLLGALELPKIFPMLMTAAGTVVPARVFIVGVGVAGLQAIATARRLGAVVSAYDIRPAVKEQVESLGAKFVEIELETGNAESAGGYAREMDEAFYRKQREKMLEVVAESDVVITTAAIPGRRAPTLITGEMVEAMRPGTVIIDLAAERGGNCELTVAGETVSHNGVRIAGPLNVASGLANHASQLFSKNVVTFVAELVKDGELNIDRSDEIISATLVLDSGKAASAEVAERLGLSAPAGGAE